MFALMLASCAASRLNINESTYVSDHVHLGAVSKIIFKNGNFYYFENSGMFYSQGAVSTTNSNRTFFLKSDPHLVNPYIYSNTFKDSVADKQHLIERSPILNGYITIDNKMLEFRKDKIYFNGYQFSRLK